MERNLAFRFVLIFQPYTTATDLSVHLYPHHTVPTVAFAQTTRDTWHSLGKVEAHAAAVVVDLKVLLVSQRQSRSNSVEPSCLRIFRQHGILRHESLRRSEFGSADARVHSRSNPSAAISNPFLRLRKFKYLVTSTLTHGGSSVPMLDDD
ncbi:hypothetical protein C8F04DRAFT_247080 [Mycena alexandri]|uniref:Uncharacterized protein n=1 Tax=Mycena alexandri TaxID=1745969 RepID=A0AAD6WSM9_9AGAR|nr:hypothetical protein C8F04DRAFT_247080 [Mycena alexandri]